MNLNKTVSTFLRDRVYNKIEQKSARVKMTCEECFNFIKENEKVLDLGCGSGHLTAAIKNRLRADITGIDIHDSRINCNFPFKIFDGGKIPFSDDFFDVVFISYVLHHSDAPVFLLKEAKRVAAKRVIIYEDSPENIFSDILCRIHKFSFNEIFYGKKEKIFKKFTFKTKEQWREIFKKLRLKIIFQKKIKMPYYWFYPVPRMLFVLEKVK